MEVVSVLVHAVIFAAISDYSPAKPLTIFLFSPPFSPLSAAWVGRSRFGNVSGAYAIVWAWGLVVQLVDMGVFNIVAATAKLSHFLGSHNKHTGLSASSTASLSSEGSTIGDEPPRRT